LEVRTKLRREIEPRWVAEYCSKFYPGLVVKYRVPLGPVPEELVKQVGLEKALRQYRPWRPEADALVFTPEKLVLIEGKVFRIMDGLAKLPMYKLLIPATPELQQFTHLPIHMQLLVVKAVEPWITLAKSTGVELVEWAPTWVQQVFLQRDRYWTREAVALRERRKEVLRRLGFE